MPLINLSFQHIKITTPTIYTEEKDRPSRYVRSYQQCQQTILQQYWSIGRSIQRCILMPRCKKREAKIISSLLDLQYLILVDSWWMPQGSIRKGIRFVLSWNRTKDGQSFALWTSRYRKLDIPGSPFRIVKMFIGIREILEPFSKNEFIVYDSWIYSWRNTGKHINYCW